LQLDVSAISNWSKIEVFNYAERIMEISPSGGTQSLLMLDVPIPAEGIYGISALVTHSDGVTISTTNPLAYGAVIPVPEPGGEGLFLIGLFAFSIAVFQRKHWRSRGTRTLPKK
jgi:hypothetical protein